MPKLLKYQFSDPHDLHNKTLDDAIQILEELREKMTGKATIDFFCNYEGDTEFKIRQQRLETDEEYSKRIAEESRREEVMKLKRHQTFLELQKEFGDVKQ